jgi:hypothetical protein
MAENHGGMVVTDDDGTVYFVRDEILELCKVEGDDLETAKAILDEDSEVEGFSSLTFYAVSSPSLRIASPQIQSFDSTTLSGGVQVSTVMCPW